MSRQHKHITNEQKKLKVSLKSKPPLIPFKGTCNDFCSKRETLSRRLKNDLCLPYEKTLLVKKYIGPETTTDSTDTDEIEDITKHANVNYINNKIVEKYLPEEFRDLKTLSNCFNHLLKIYLGDSQSFECQAFITNRLKAVFLDITTQKFSGLQTAFLLKKSIRLLLLIKYNFFENFNFNKIQNTFEIHNLLKKAIKMYEEVNASFNIELYKYYILINLSSKELIKDYYYLKHIDDFKNIFQIFEAFHTENANDFFYSFLRLSFFESCAVLNYIYIFRLKIINVYRDVFKDREIDASIINERLLIQPSPDEIDFLKQHFVSLIKHGNNMAYVFNKEPILIEDRKTARKCLPINIKKIYPKNIENGINTPDKDSTTDKSLYGFY
ncbi:hypothetical protein CDIK_2680 [Cucumispora dikerogammari]|nr:hypothetical protein CDIK_2680 [Cucumispora dikerogammari]